MCNLLTKSKLLATVILFATVSICPNGQAQSPGKCGEPADAMARPQVQLWNLLKRSQRNRNQPKGGQLDMSATGLGNTNLPFFNIAPLGALLPVAGAGTLGRITKWTGFNGSNSVIGDTTIFEDKFGKIGIGTDVPTSRLSVVGIIESLSGGIKFPDGTVQTTSATGALFSLPHDATLTGNGTTASPLGVALPLSLTASVPGREVLNVTNTSTGPFPTGIRASARFIAIFAKGFDSNSGNGGNGILVTGGNGSGAGNSAGRGIEATGGKGLNGASNGEAGVFFGDVSINGSGSQFGDLHIVGTLSKGAGSFKIDHPLDPENKYLYHSFVESPDMMNIYNGNVVTDVNGEAIIELPDWFDALNRDFRYQLTVIGQFAQAIVAEEINGNRFAIKTTAPNVKVSWQVTGIRQDAYANKHRIPVEEDKPERERSFYLHPDAFNQPQERGVSWAHNPEVMYRLKMSREQVKQQ